MGPVCTVMVGRLDDWLKDVANRDDIVTDPAYLDWAGVAVMKKAYRLFKDRGYSARLLSAATRHHRHWSEFIGADMIVTLTHQWQKRFEASNIKVISRIDDAVDPEIIDGLLGAFVDFKRAYEEQGLAQGEFDGFGPTKKTLYGFTAAYQDLVRVIRAYHARFPKAAMPGALVNPSHVFSVFYSGDCGHGLIREQPRLDRGVRRRGQ